MDKVSQIEVLEPIVANGLALSLSADLSKKRIGEEVVSPAELVVVDVEGDGGSDCLSREAGGARRLGSLTTLTLGTRTQIPTRHMLDTLGVQTTSDSNVPSGYRLGTF